MIKVLIVFLIMASQVTAADPVADCPCISFKHAKALIQETRSEIIFTYGYSIGLEDERRRVIQHMRNYLPLATTSQAAFVEEIATNIEGQGYNLTGSTVSFPASAP